MFHNTQLTQQTLYRTAAFFILFRYYIFNSPQSKRSRTTHREQLLPPHGHVQALRFFECCSFLVDLKLSSSAVPNREQFCYGKTSNTHPEGKWTVPVLLCTAHRCNLSVKRTKLFFMRFSMPDSQISRTSLRHSLNWTFRSTKSIASKKWKRFPHLLPPWQHLVLGFCFGQCVRCLYWGTSFQLPSNESVFNYWRFAKAQVVVLGAVLVSCRILLPAMLLAPLFANCECLHSFAALFFRHSLSVLRFDF